MAVFFCINKEIKSIIITNTFNIVLKNSTIEQTSFRFMLYGNTKNTLTSRFLKHRENL